MKPTRGDVVRQLDILRGALRVAMTTIRKMKHGQSADPDAVLLKLAAIREDAKELRDNLVPRIDDHANALLDPHGRQTS